MYNSSREIKFRAFCQGQMWSVTDINYTGQDLTLRGMDIGMLNSELEGFRDFIKNVDLMQYTGLKDKNNKEIYEGDIIKGSANVVGTGKVVFKEYDDDEQYSTFKHLGWCIMFSVANHTDWATCSLADFVGEVIGNIYENPELLNE